MNQSKSTIQQLLGISDTKEAKVTINLKQVKLGNRRIKNKEVVTIYDGIKRTFQVPFKQELKYEYQSVEDEMVFKYALLSNEILVGFIYLEIPDRYKVKKKFEIDDWFPIKEIETENNHEKDNFVARVIIKYQAKRVYNVKDNLEANLALKKGYNVIVGDLKRKINKIYTDIDNYEGEGMNHLQNFHQKILKRKMYQRKFKKNKKKSFSPQNFMNKQKKYYYETINNIKKDKSINKIKSSDLYQFQERKPVNDDDLVMELSQTKQHLIKVQQELDRFKRREVSVDNLKYQEKLKEQEDKLNMKKRQLNFKISEANDMLQQEKQVLEEKLELEKLDLEILKKKTQNIMDQFYDRLEEVNKKEEEVNQLKEELQQEREELIKKQKSIKVVDKEQKEEKENLDDINEEINDQKKRLMVERQLIIQEKQNLDKLRRQLQLEKDQFEAEKKLKSLDLTEQETQYLKQQQHLENLILENQQMKKFLNLEKGNVKKEQTSVNQQLELMFKKEKELKSENIKQSRLKERHDQELIEIIEYKEQLQKEYDEFQQKMDKDYDYIQNELVQLEENKKDIQIMKQNLEKFENYLNDLYTIQNDQLENLQFLQSNFVEKLKIIFNNSNQFKSLEKDFKLQIEEFENMTQSTNNIYLQIQKERQDFSSHLVKLTQHTNIIKLKERQQDTRIRRRTTQQKIFDTNYSVEQKILIKRQAEDLVENIFKDVSYKTSKLNNNFSITQDMTEEELLENSKNIYTILLEKLISQVKEKRTLMYFHQSKFFLHRITDKMSQQIKMQKVDINENDLFDKKEILKQQKKKYEQKMLKLINYIKHIKKNEDFFNDQIDKEIMISK